MPLTTDARPLCKMFWNTWYVNGPSEASLSSVVTVAFLSNTVGTTTPLKSVSTSPAALPTYPLTTTRSRDRRVSGTSVKCTRWVGYAMANAGSPIKLKFRALVCEVMVSEFLVAK